MNAIQIPAVIAKGEISACLELIGCVNNGLFAFDGTDYPLHALQYAGFVGAINLSDRLYHGHHTFKKTATSGIPLSDEMDFNELPGLESE